VSLAIQLLARALLAGGVNAIGLTLRTGIRHSANPGHLRRLLPESK
jgi:hypothetical protein